MTHEDVASRNKQYLNRDLQPHLCLPNGIIPGGKQIGPDGAYFCYTFTPKSGNTIRCVLLCDDLNTVRCVP